MYSPLNSYAYIHWILDFKYILLLLDMFSWVLASGMLLEVVEGLEEVGSKRHSLQAVELSQCTQAAVQIVSNLPTPSDGGPIYRFCGMPTMRTRWVAGVAAHKNG